MSEHRLIEEANSALRLIEVLRGRVNDSEQRAQQAEANNARLREALQDIARGPLQGPGDFEKYAQAVAERALATPPESGPQPSGIDTLLDEMAAYAVVSDDGIIKGLWTANNWDHMEAFAERYGWSIAPLFWGQQGQSLTANGSTGQTEEALAALERLVRMAEGDELVCKPGKAQSVAEIVRRHLTASGVPYVPEEVRHRIADEIHDVALAKDEADGCIDWGEIYEVVKRALASAPADGRKLVPVEIAESMRWLAERYVANFDSDCQFVSCITPGHDRESPYYQEWDKVRRYFEGERIAAAPQRGGE